MYMFVLILISFAQTAKYKSAGQPFAAEATDFVKHEVLGKSVTLRLLRKDQVPNILMYAHVYACRYTCL